MLVKTILITIFGIFAVIVLISEYYNKKAISNILKPLLIIMLSIFYYLAANKIDFFIISALAMSFISSLFMIKSTYRTNNIIIFFMSLFSLLFSVAVLKTNYFLQYIPVWFFIYLILILLISYFIFKKISNKITMINKAFIITFLISNSLLLFIVLSRVWRFRSILLTLPIAGVALIFIFSLLFLFHNYNKEITNGKFYITTSYIYGQLLLTMGVMSDWQAY